eukprot:1963183-Rhodomonas_salina.1
MDSCAGFSLLSFAEDLSEEECVSEEEAEAEAEATVCAESAAGITFMAESSGAQEKIEELVPEH